MIYYALRHRMQALGGAPCTASSAELLSPGISPGVNALLAPESSAPETSTAEVQAVIESSDIAPLNFMEDLNILIRLFDEVLAEEYTSEHLQLPYACSSPPGPDSDYAFDLHCDFCGADIFQSFFQCSRCMPRQGKHEQNQLDELVLCVGCYAEGRTCKCGSMMPYQCRRFDNLVADRNNAVKVLKALTTKTSHSEIPIHWYVNFDHPRDFKWTHPTVNSPSVPDFACSMALVRCTEGSKFQTLVVRLVNLLILWDDGRPTT
jgi:hypothetical protein